MLLSATALGHIENETFFFVLYIIKPKGWATFLITKVVEGGTQKTLEAFLSDDRLQLLRPLSSPSVFVLEAG